MIFRHFISFFWTSYVSFSRGALDGDTTVARSSTCMHDKMEGELGSSVNGVAMVRA